jgi:hypothetical protein
VISGPNVLFDKAGIVMIVATIVGLVVSVCSGAHVGNWKRCRIGMEAAERRFGGVAGKLGIE